MTPKFPFVLRTILLLITPILVISAPATARNNLFARDDEWIDIRPCVFSDQFDICTAYFATSDADVLDYRTAAIYTNDCTLLAAVKVSKTLKAITFNNKPDSVNLWLDANSVPNGYIYYQGVETQVGRFDTAGKMKCFHPPHADGTGCRVMFDCPGLRA